jgi:hypothetical protein
LELYAKERRSGEEFNSFIARAGIERLKEHLEPLKQVPEFLADPSFYEDYGHEHESFAVRKGIRGECAGATVAETIPAIATAWEMLAQAEAFFYHKEYQAAVLAAYEAAAAAARVPLYPRLVDPFNADQALWEFENLFVLSGETEGAWQNVSSEFASMKADGIAAEDVRQTSVCRSDARDDSSEFMRQTEVCPTKEFAARRIIEAARQFANYVVERGPATDREPAVSAAVAEAHA